MPPVNLQHFLVHSHFRFSTFHWLHSIMPTPYFWWEYHFLFMPSFSRRQLALNTRAGCMHFVVFWDVMSCSLVHRFHQNLGTHLPNDMTSHPIRLELSDLSKQWFSVKESHLPKWCLFFMFFSPLCPIHMHWEGKSPFLLMFLLFTTMHGGVEACSHRWTLLIVVAVAANDGLPLVHGLQQQ